MAQLNQVLETRESARGLIVSMPDVLFDFNKYTLKSEARERLAKVSGILMAYPGLNVKVEGHTDNIGSLDYNQKLSDQRAETVRGFMVSQGVAPDIITAQGFGMNQPVAPNDTAGGRSKNRRVQLVVNGSAIGDQAGAAGSATGGDNPSAPSGSLP
jgi:outer membrane protein OmpA-like peptidoglycan-associated protein